MTREFKLVFGVLLALFASQALGNVVPAINIIGGSSTVRGEFPWMVSIQFNSITGARHICGGAIINETSIVTTAHCASFEPKDLVIVAGAYNIKEAEITQQKRTPSSIYIHPQYENDEIVRHDLAVIYVYPPFQFNTYVNYLRLPAERHKAVGDCYIAGWGQTEYAISSDVMLKARIPVVDRTDCKIKYGELLDAESQVCAGYPQGGVDACSGDTGSPLMCQDIGHIYLAGMASWGYKCAQPSYPGVYTELSFYTQNISPSRDLGSESVKLAL